MKREVRTLALLFALPISLLAGLPARAAPSVTKINKLPYVITAPGAYLVQKNLSFAGTAITVAASNVDLDLGGHTLSGTSGLGDGIHVEGQSSVSIHDGAVQGFYTGVEVRSTLDAKVTNVTANLNIFGIAGQNSTTRLTVMGCAAARNGDTGIVFDSDSRANTISQNTTNQNYIGIRISCGAFANTVMGNTANGNRFAGIQLECDTSGNTVTGNTTEDNGDRGISLYANGNTVTGNTSDLNMYSGIDIDGGSHGNTVADNSATGNGDGIRLLDNPSQNTVRNNTTTGSRFGIWLGGGANSNTIQGNTANLNTRGITVDQGGSFNTILSNTALSNRDFDLEDDNFNCDSNFWFRNIFKTANQPCVAGLPKPPPPPP
jgi:parallel beta-helix repeat protein